MIQKAAKIAGGIAVGSVIVGCILPRILFPTLSVGARPSILKEAALYFSTGFLAAFSVLLLIDRIKEARNQGNRPSDQNAQSGSNEEKALFDSKLSAGIDWGQVNGFLRTTQFYKQLLLNDWQKSDAFTAYPVSETSMDCLRCLHEDLSNCYQGAFAFDENGREDRHEEYRLLRENLCLKYGSLDEDIIENIYLYYLQEDR